MAKNAKAEKISSIVEMLKGLDTDDLTIIEVMAERFGLPVASETQEIEDTEITEEPDLDFGEEEGEGDGDDLDLDEGEGDDLDLDEGEGDDLDEGEGDDLDLDNDEDLDIFEDEPKPVGRRNREKETTAKKPAAKPAPKPAAKPVKTLKEVPAPSPIIRMVKGDTALDTRRTMFDKLKELGIVKSTLPDTDAETLHKGLRFIFAKSYGDKAFDLKALTARAEKAGIEVKFPKGNRGDDLKKQAILVTLMNEGVIAWPGTK